MNKLNIQSKSSALKPGEPSLMIPISLNDIGKYKN